MAGKCSSHREKIQEDLHHRRSRLKIRRGPSSAALAGCSSSFHGSCRQMMFKKGCTSIPSRQPLIIQSYDPEVLDIEPAEFMLLVQWLTGSPATQKSLDPSTQRSLNPSMEKCKELESSAHLKQSAPDTETSVPQDPVKVIKQAKYGANPFAASSSPFSEQLNLNAEHTINDQPPFSSISANSSTYEETNSAYTSPMSCSPPLSPDSSLTTSLEGPFFIEEGGASSSCREGFCCLKEGSTRSTAEEDGGISFFVFSGDSYYGSHSHVAAPFPLP